MIDDWENSYTGIIKEEEIIGHPATLSDLHRWIIQNVQTTMAPTIYHHEDEIRFYGKTEETAIVSIPYDSSKELLDQSEETLEKIISLINENAKEKNAA